jgi:hypothetical protein
MSAALIAATAVAFGAGTASAQAPRPGGITVEFSGILSNYTKASGHHAGSISMQITQASNSIPIVGTMQTFALTNKTKIVSKGGIKDGDYGTVKFQLGDVPPQGLPNSAVATLVDQS